MKQMFVDILKKTRLYIPAKKAKDSILGFFRDDREERRRMIGFYSQFIKKGDICFDIGANLGSRTAIFLACGARVVAIEPQSSCINALQRKYGSNPNVIILKAGVGEKEGIKEMKICNAPEFSTFSETQLNKMSNLQETKNLEWYKTEKVNIVTLDSLIKKYGEPSFCKIDVEGYEKEVLGGLSKPIKLLSFEYNTLLVKNALACINQLDKLSRLGKGKIGKKGKGECKYEFNYSVKESMSFRLNNWVSPGDIKKILNSMPQSSFSFGDIYARLS